VSAVAYLEGGTVAVREAMWSQRRHRPDPWEVLALSVGGGAGLGSLVGASRWALRATGFLTQDEILRAFSNGRRRKQQ
jgi:hypothetical protein